MSENILLHEGQATHPVARRSVAAGIAGALGMALVGLFPAGASAQEFPSHFLTMIVGYAPGAATDLLARLAAAEMSKSLGQPIPVENRPGANSATAARSVVQAPADGYNLLLGASAMIANFYGMKDPGYVMNDTKSDFTVIGGFAYSPFVLFVNTKKSGAKTFKDLVAYGKANPGKLTYASLGPSSPANLASQRVQSLTGIGWTEIPYKSGNDALLAIIAGTVDAYFGAPASAPQAAGRADVSILANSGKTRSSNLPDVPTFKELGFEVYDSFSYGVLVKAGTPAPVVAKLRKSFDDAKKNPEVVSKVGSVGLLLYTGTADEYDAELKEQAKVFEKDFKTLGIEKE